MSSSRPLILATAVAMALLPILAYPLSPKEIATTIVEFMGKNGLANSNDMEMLKFTIARPSCAQTIYEHTVQQDYTLIATVIGMKAAKAGAAVSISGLESFNQQQCRDLSPLKRLYTFLDATGDRFVPNAPGLKGYAQQQIDNGKTQLEGQLTSVPFGDVLKEWPCLCDAAFETNLSEEKLATEAYSKGAKLVAAAQSGDVGKVVEIAIAEFGADLGCQLGVEYSQVGHVPVVGDAAFSACSTLGMAVGWVVKNGWNAAVSMGEVISGQTQHIPTAEYYELYWKKYLHEHTLAALRLGTTPSTNWYTTDYNACVSYFDSHTASKAHAQEWCAKMRSESLAKVNALVGAFKLVPEAYYYDQIAALMPELVLEQYALIGPQSNFLSLSPFNNIGAVCQGAVAQAIPIQSPLPGKYPGAPQLGSAPFTAWEWACTAAMDIFRTAALDYRANSVPALIASMQGKACAVASGGGNQLRFQCETVPGFVGCRDTLLGTVSDPLAHCGVAAAAVPKLAAQIAADLGSKRCRVSPGNARNVECTRPWKVDACKNLIAQYAPGVQFNFSNEPSCTLAADAQFDAAVVTAQGLLGVLNGVDPNAPAPGVSGASQSIFSQGSPCNTTFDPLSLTCTTPAPLAKLASPLPVCPPDPNQDGADAPCYDGPLTEGAPGPNSATAVPQIPTSPGALPEQDRSGVTSASAATADTAPSRAAVPAAPLGRPAQVLVEAEQLVGAGAAVNQGRVDVQPMAGFGTQWSGSAQLFWSGTRIGATLDMIVDVREAGAYAVVLRMTQAPDYADVSFAVDGQASFLNFVAYAPRVTAADAPIGTFNLQPGTHTIRVTVTGKQAQSSNFFVGVDRITLTMLTRSQ